MYSIQNRTFAVGQTVPPPTSPPWQTGAEITSLFPSLLFLALWFVLARFVTEAMDDGTMQSEFTNQHMSE
jgi:hypothetical protein